MYPRHGLVGLNHQALVDCQQTRLVCMAYDELCRSIAERGREWQPDMVAPSTQTCILDWLTRRDDAGDSKEKQGTRPPDAAAGGGDARLARAAGGAADAASWGPEISGLGGPEVRLAIPTFSGSLFSFS
ncbi:hypothetical protein CIB48_g4744 [Xylaria polymorpha]|nr:hypothetical protein CIB48_g4744 [Xylaria polymorpha]